MVTRLRFLQGATALLYFGPLLAGLGGAGWEVIPAFVAIFLTWLFVLRPQQWPRNLADWARPEALTSLATQGAVQLLLVVVCFGIGRGVGGVLGAMPDFPAMLPLAISFLSVPISRMLWDPWKADATEQFLDEALAQLNGVMGDEAASDAVAGRVRLAGRLVMELDRLAVDTDPDTLTRHLHAIAAETGHGPLRAALMDPIYDGTASPLLWRAAIVHATDGRVADMLGGATYGLSVFNELTSDAQFRLFARRCRDMVLEDPSTAAEGPDAGAVRAAAVAYPGAASDLLALAQALDEAGAAG